MFIGITGTTSSGKHLVAEYLVKKHGFSLLTLENKLDTYERDIYNQTISFSNVNDILDHATASWAENYVVCDLECHDLWSLR
jgi:dCMP deaminase